MGQNLSEPEAALFEGEGSFFRMTIVQYQFPQIENDKWDSNWLIVEGLVSLNGKEWTFKDPCITTFEVARLADWLDAQAKGAAQRDFCAFTEPNLEFERHSDNSIRVRFSHESSPPWSMPNFGDKNCGFDIPLKGQLSVIADQLRRQLARFPQRAA